MTIKYIPGDDNGLRVHQEERKNIRLSRDLLEMAEVGLHCPEYNEIINKLKEGGIIKDLPTEQILHQFARKKKKTGKMVNAYDELHTIDTGRGELVYLGSKLVPSWNARLGIVETAYQGHVSPETIYNNLKKYYFWPQMLKFMEAKAKTCDSCWKHKKSKPLSSKPLSPVSPGVLT